METRQIVIDVPEKVLLAEKTNEALLSPISIPYPKSPAIFLIVVSY